MKHLIKYYGKYALLIIAALLFLTGEAICELQLPGYMSDLITEGVGSGNMSTIWHYGWQMLVIALIACICAVMVGFFSSRVAAYVSRDLRSDLFRQVMNFASEEYNRF